MSDPSRRGQDEREEKGKRFLELIDEQNRVMWKITARLALLIRAGWASPEHRNELESLMKRHAEIMEEIDGADGGAGHPR